jgi:UDP-N-acetyl-D-glucosamine dehydrogenase
LISEVSVIGLGYVGLPAAIAASKSGFKVIGIDLNDELIDQLNKGTSNVKDVPNSDLKNALSDNRFKASSDFSLIRNSEVVLICVPTPLKEGGKPDLSFVEAATKSVAKHLKNGSILILESTVMPGVTKSVVLPLVERFSDLTATDFYLAYSPERIDPLNKTWNITNTPKLVAGLNLDSREKAVKFYSKFVDSIIECESIEVAETAKLLENSFRLVNISFINELSMFCEKIGIDIGSVINAASTKPYGFMPFYPSIGVGGHCIPVDPIYLASKAEELKVPQSLINLAVEINKKMPLYFAGRVEKEIGNINGRKIIIIGVSYKPNVADVRESPVKELIKILREKGALVSWHDDLVKDWDGEKSVALSNKYDLAILATPHDYLDLTKLGDVPILNTRGSI